MTAVRVRHHSRSTVVQVAHRWFLIVDRDGWVPFSQRNGCAPRRYWKVPRVGWVVRYGRIRKMETIHFLAGVRAAENARKS